MCPIYGSKHSHRGHISNHVISLIFWVLSKGTRQDLNHPFPFIPCSLWIFLWEYVWESFCIFQLVYWANCSTCWSIILFFLFEYIWFTMLCFKCTAKWFSFTYTCIWASHLAEFLKKHPAMREIWVQSLGSEDMLKGTWRASPVFLPGESHGQWSLEGYSP